MLVSSKAKFFSCPFSPHYTQIDSGDEELEPPPSYRAKMDRRRKSVFAESYEPGEDDSAVEKVPPIYIACGECRALNFSSSQEINDDRVYSSRPLVHKILWLLNSRNEPFGGC